MPDDMTERIGALCDALDEFFDQENIDPIANRGAQTLQGAIPTWAQTGRIDYSIFDMAAEQLGLSMEQQEALIDSLFSVCDLSDADIEDEGDEEAVPQSNSGDMGDMDAVALWRKELQSPDCARLTRAETLSLSGKLLAGREAKNLLQDDTPQLSPEDKESLKSIVKEGEAAKERMIKGVLRYAFKVTRNAMTYIEQSNASFNRNEFGFADALAQANLGIVEALDRFDPSKKCSLQYYCVFWIRKYIFMGIDDTRPIRVPQHMFRDVGRINKAIDELRADEQTPTIELISQKTGLSQKRIKAVLDQAKQTTVWNIDDLLPQDESSYDAEKPVSAESSLDLSTIDLLLGDDHSPEDIAKLIVAMNHNLEPIEAKTVVLYFGFEDGEERTFEQIGQLFGYTKQNMEKILRQALEKIRAMPMSEIYGKKR